MCALRQLSGILKILTWTSFILFVFSIEIFRYDCLYVIQIRANEKERAIYAEKNVSFVRWSVRLCPPRNKEMFFSIFAPWLDVITVRLELHCLHLARRENYLQYRMSSIEQKRKAKLNGTQTNKQNRSKNEPGKNVCTVHILRGSEQKKKLVRVECDV